MPLKAYQTRALHAVERYLRALAAERDGGPDFVERAWRAVSDAPHRPRRTGSGRPVPAFCIQLPTGGGKTYLAVRVMDLAQRLYLGRRTGLVLWVVPTRCIYRQTLAALRDRGHPYRQFLDVTTGGRVRVVEKTDRFHPLDLAEQLVILVLMLPSANRRDGRTLRLFQDQGGWEPFFPPEWDGPAHRRLLERWPNLDHHGSLEDPLGVQVKTSLGNVLRMAEPLLILDEGQRAYSAGAQRTLLNFNPSLMVELSATPPARSPVLVRVSGRELLAEQMVKLDLHVVNAPGPHWQDALAESVRWRARLEEAARQFEAASGRYIRPICLIQVERTGRDQRTSGRIHADDVVWELVHTHRVPRDQIAVKSSERDDIEGMDLLARSCPVRFIITRQALQEGWDCPFAYVLTVLTNPSSAIAMTQLVGRILRQPYVQKTGIPMLDESYVFCFRREAGDLVSAIREELSREGLGDLAAMVQVSTAPPAGPGPAGHDPAVHDSIGVPTGDVLTGRDPKVRRRDAPAAERVARRAPDSGEAGEGPVAARSSTPAPAWTPEGPSSGRGLALSGLGRLRPPGTGRPVTDGHGSPSEFPDEARRPPHGPEGREPPDGPVNRLRLARTLGEVVPNPWVAWELVDRGLAILRAGGWTEEDLVAHEGEVAAALLAAVRAELAAGRRTARHRFM
ncbi:MAG: DEAD/DEAH box helicase family protein [Alicyclobacillus sp.]|nr:DEAD/DEAH box helicase family protein [Alicyclobacillus sp.]